MALKDRLGCGIGLRARIVRRAAQHLRSSAVSWRLAAFIVGARTG
jgi:hypothetical protein